MIAEGLGLKLNLIPVDLPKGGHLSEDFLKINPQHTLPTLVDNGFVIWESRAICIYLVEKYGGSDNSFYPSDVQTRATINQRVIFDYGLYERFRSYFHAPIFGREFNPEDLKKCEESIDILEKLLVKDFFAGTKTLTVADVLLFSTVGCFDAIGFNLASYPNITKWLANMKKIAPGREINEKNVEAFIEFFKQFK